MGFIQDLSPLYYLCSEEVSHRQTLGDLAGCANEKVESYRRIDFTANPSSLPGWLSLEWHDYEQINIRIPPRIATSMRAEQYYLVWFELAGNLIAQLATLSTRGSVPR